MYSVKESKIDQAVQLMFELDMNEALAKSLVIAAVDNSSKIESQFVAGISNLILENI